jgi:hypothetical protein
LLVRFLADILSCRSGYDPLRSLRQPIGSRIPSFRNQLLARFAEALFINCAYVISGSSGAFSNPIKQVIAALHSNLAY